MTGGKAWVLTNPLLLKPDGTKMGKTEKGAVWLDGSMTSPFEYFQYWINVEDPMVDRLLKWFTFLPLEAIAALVAGPIHLAKAKLAWEATALCHGAAEASRALATSMLLFGLDEHVAWDDVVPAGGERPAPDIPTAVISGEPLVDGLPVFRLFAEAGLAGSGKQAKNLAQQGGAYVNGVARQAFDKVTRADLRDDGTLLLRAGKKKYCLVSLG